MTSHTVQGSWFRAAGYGRFRGEWVKFLFNCTHFCPIIRRVPKKNVTAVPSHPSSRTPPRYKGQVLLSRGNVLILSLHLTRVLWTPLTRTEDTFILFSELILISLLRQHGLTSAVHCNILYFCFNVGNITSVFTTLTKNHS